MVVMHFTRQDFAEKESLVDSLSLLIDGSVDEIFYPPLNLLVFKYSVV
jgi:hypothetical protein